MLALTNARLVTGAEIIDKRAVLIERGRIKSIVKAGDIPVGVRKDDLNGAFLAPGFVDTQVNGGGGALFNDNPSVETISVIAEAHRQFGTTAFLPTLISDDIEKIESAIRAVDEAIETGVPGVLGVHLEGPFLSTDRKGVHDPSKFRTLEEHHLPLLTSLKNGKTLITLSPESARPELIRKLKEQGAIVSAGHTNATYAQMMTALEAGVTGFTHLFNAMSPMTSREPGVVGAALEDQSAWCGIIVDGRHVAPASLKIALRCRPMEKFMLVTDAMPTVGMREKSFTLQGRRIVVKDGVCVSENGTLAGSNLDMARALRNSIELLQTPLFEAVNMASRNPAAFLGLASDLGAIAPGKKANLVAMNASLHVVSTWIDGIKHSAAEAGTGNDRLDAVAIK